MCRKLWKNAIPRWGTLWIFGGEPACSSTHKGETRRPPAALFHHAHGPGTVADVTTGPLPENITSDLEAIKLHLADLAGADLPPDLTKAMAVEISAIRLHLKRLAADHAAAYADHARRVLDS